MWAQSLGGYPGWAGFKRLIHAGWCNRCKPCKRCEAHVTGVNGVVGVTGVTLSSGH